MSHHTGCPCAWCKSAEHADKSIPHGTTRRSGHLRSSYVHTTSDQVEWRIGQGPVHTSGRREIEQLAESTGRHTAWLEEWVTRYDLADLIHYMDRKKS